jgi:predicted transposase YdaD
MDDAIAKTQESMDFVYQNSDMLHAYRLYELERFTEQRKIKQAKLEVAGNLLKMGLSIEQVVQGTGLSLAAVKKLAKELGL